MIEANLKSFPSAMNNAKYLRKTQRMNNAEEAVAECSIGIGVQLPSSFKGLGKSVSLAFYLLPGEVNRPKIKKVSDKADDRFS